MYRPNPQSCRHRLVRRHLGERDGRLFYCRLTRLFRTNYGYVIEPQTSLMRQRIKSIGIGLTDRVEGPFDLRIHKIWATNGMGEAEHEEEMRICGADALPIDEGVGQG